MLTTSFNHYSTRKVILFLISMLMEMILLHQNNGNLNYKNCNLQKFNIFSVLLFKQQTLSNLNKQCNYQLENKKPTFNYWIDRSWQVNVSIIIVIQNEIAVEKYDAQPYIELLRQMIELQGTFDRTKLFLQNIEDVTLLIAGGPPGG
ncbi:unnamed protein product [Paramecium primaurelia]|uniref:Uncharacterized protein n=1 Tax=Paramecium primaurelia TaxID=5886 RepID=A0A8S1N3R5_PARPR|nr:unnamed protein product [Paramecium primaurelia]